MKLIVLTIFFLFTANCLGQITPKKRNTISIAEIQKMFPYNKTASIKLVSFKYDITNNEFDSTNVEPIAYEPEIPKTNDTVDLAKMFEVKTLPKRTHEKLFKLLVNHTDDDRPVLVTFCYEPRNAILFYDGHGNILGYIEICFDCEKLEAVPSSIVVTTFFEEEFDELKEVFRDAGITYGIVPLNYPSRE